MSRLATLARALCALVAGFPCSPDARAAEPATPNLLFILLDDFGWRDAGFMGSDFYETPHLDALAAQGMVFTNAYSCAANCAPARASLLSGWYSPRHEVFNVGTAPRGKAAHRRLRHVPGTATLRPDIPTWADHLQETGYRTATMGKWHVSDDPGPHGFDVNVGGTRAGSPPRGYYPPHGDVPGLRNVPENEFLTDTLADRAARFIADNRDRQWALLLSHFAVHTPIQAKRDLVAKFAAKPPGRLHHHVPMATMIQAVDDGVGRLLATLDETGQRGNTVIVFSSDNGGYGPVTDMAPLKGYKGTYYEGGIRVPFFVVWPRVVAPASTCPVPVSGVDLLPTFCEIAGVRSPDDDPVDGVSLVPLLADDPAAADRLADRPLFWHFPAYLESYRGGDSLEQRDPLFRTRPCSVIRAGKWKLHEFFEDGSLELYDLDADPGETTNLAAIHPAISADLHERLRRWRTEIGAPVPTEPNPDFDPKAEADAIARSRSPASSTNVESP